MPKFAKKRARTPESDDSGRDDGGKLSAKKTKTGKPEDQFWPISNLRRVTVSEYHKRTMVNIREYYEADGELKPGKKGISLTVEQYKELLKAIPAINEELQKQGHHDVGEETQQPKSTTATSSSSVTKKGKENGTKTTPSSSTTNKKSKKANIEATSDEDESDG